MSDRGRFEHAVRTTHGGRHCSTCTQFYESGGVVHPIRSSPGYDPSVEHVSRQERARHTQEARYRGVERERGAQVVQRPPWAAGLSERHLVTIARAHGQSAGAHLWWEKAGLYEGMAERNYALRESGSRVDTRTAGRMIERRVTRAERGAARRVAIASATGGGDLPF